MNRSSSAGQQELALDVARFLTLVEQNAFFLRETNRVPANRRVLINQRLYPEIYTFILQSRTAIVLPPAIMNDAVLAAGNNLYTSVLSGLNTPEEGFCSFFDEITNIEGLGVIEDRDACKTEIEIP